MTLYLHQSAKAGDMNPALHERIRTASPDARRVVFGAFDAAQMAKHGYVASAAASMRDVKRAAARLIGNKS